jgi:hypothetical protein
MVIIKDVNFKATIEEREVSARGSIRPCLTWMSRNCFQKARTEDLSQTQTPGNPTFSSESVTDYDLQFYKVSQFN